MQELARDGHFAYVKFEEPEDVDRLQIRSVETDPTGFEFFRGLGIVGYAQTFKLWLRHFPRPVFLGALRDRELVAWVFIEGHQDPAPDGALVCVLRAIETLPPLRGKRIGHRLMLFGLRQVTGYVLTKPLTEKARAFFVRAGFADVSEGRHPPVEPRRFPGYLFLSPSERRAAIVRLEDYFPTLADAGGGLQGARTPGSPEGRL